MAVTSFVYTLAQQSILAGQVDWMTHDIKVALLSSGYTPNQDTHRYFSDLTNEITGTGYVPGGISLTTKTVVVDTALNRVVLSADDPTWPAATFTARYAVYYRDTGNDATSPLLCCWNLGADVSSPGGDFVLTVSATDGILNSSTPVAA